MLYDSICVGIESTFFIFEIFFEYKIFLIYGMSKSRSFTHYQQSKEHSKVQIHLKVQAISNTHPEPA